MVKYVVVIDKEKENGVIDEEDVGYYDTQEEADEVACKTAVDMEVDDPSKYEVIVMEIDEKSLETEGEWNSFTEADEISSYEVGVDED